MSLSRADEPRRAARRHRVGKDEEPRGEPENDERDDVEPLVADGQEPSDGGRGIAEDHLVRMADAAAEVHLGRQQSA
jgi:hypothetical protein